MGDAYTYDGFGNLTAKTPTKGRPNWGNPAKNQAFQVNRIQPLAANGGMNVTGGSQRKPDVDVR